MSLQFCHCAFTGLKTLADIHPFRKAQACYLFREKRPAVGGKRYLPFHFRHHAFTILKPLIITRSQGRDFKRKGVNSGNRCTH